MAAFVGALGRPPCRLRPTRAVTQPRMKVATRGTTLSEARVEEMRARIRATVTKTSSKILPLLDLRLQVDVFLQELAVDKDSRAGVQNVMEVLDELQVDDDIVVAGALRGLGCSEFDIEERFGANVLDVLRRDEEFQKLTSSVRQDGAAVSLFSFFGDFACLTIELAHAVAWIRHLEPGAASRFTSRRNEVLRILRVHVPLADTLGCWALQCELEEMVFQHLHPQAYEEMCILAGNRLQQYGSLLGDTIRKLETTLTNLPQFRKMATFRVSGRIKNCFSIYQKMMRKSLSFEEISDFVALRVILTPKDGLTGTQACYRVWDEVGRRWDVVEGSRRDYISNPKDNGYQSLHITVTESGLPLEIQVRTEPMHECSEYGSAAHHIYKEEAWLV